MSLVKQLQLDIFVYLFNFRLVDCIKHSKYNRYCIQSLSAILTDYILKLLISNFFLEYQIIFNLVAGSFSLQEK